MQKTHIILGNHPETEDLIEELKQHGLDFITVIDDEMNNSLKRRGDVVCASKEYVENTRHSQVAEFHYHYITPPRRKDGVAWRVKRVIGSLHGFLTKKKR